MDLQSLSKPSLYLISLIIFGLIVKFIMNRCSNKTDSSKIKKKYTFIHIPKNAGTSLRNILDNSKYSKTIPISFVPHSYPEKRSNEIVILRDPIDRFISAFYYSKQKWANDLNKQFIDPNELAEALADKNNLKHNIAFDMISNNSDHTVLGKKTRYLWTYMPQSTWCINNPKYILRYEYLESDFNKLLKQIGYKHYIELPKSNKSVHYNSYLSDKAKDFIYNFYESDYDLLKKHQVY